MKILRLSAENIKRLSVVEIQPDGQPVIVIGGKNGAGKSSVLDAIAMALGGAALIPGQPIRRGQQKAKVQVDLGDIVVTRTFTSAGGGSLIVANKDGARYPSPQAMLDKLIGRLSFDPLAFERMEPKVQRETLRHLVGLDTRDLDEAAKVAYDNRTVRHRTIKTLESQLTALPEYPDAPPEDVSIAALTTQLEQAERSTQALTAARTAYDARVRECAAARDQVMSSEAEITQLRAQLARAESELVSRQQTLQDKTAAVDAARLEGVAIKAAVIDAAPLRARLVDAETVNGQVRTNRERRRVEADLEVERQAAQGLTQQLDDLERQRRHRLTAAAFPVPGISLDDVGVTLDGVPFDQASQAQRLRVSVAIGLAMNPTLKVLLVREGSALDSDSLRLLAELAGEADAQVWLERVAESAEGVSVLIEDGAVKAVEEPAKV